MEKKKSVFKKWWFWLIIVVIIIGVAAAAGGSKDEAQKVGENKSTSQGANNTTEQEEKTEFKVGDIIAFDGKEVTVTSVERNYNSGNQFITPAEGKEYVKVNVLIENKSDSTASYNVLEWKIEDGNGAIEDADGLSFTIDDALSSGELSKNGKKSGAIVFEAPLGDALTLHYQPGFWSNKEVTIKL
ncbi:MAG: DUF4352 domain-containing protein [Candidatus Nomurabacteria bacterium]|jgi:hypothetical protein|nr:DUF4352 domain-containing protein [Candidatus Nomurabacteria bacterium]